MRRKYMGRMFGLTWWEAPFRERVWIRFGTYRFEFRPFLP